MPGPERPAPPANAILAALDRAAPGALREHCLEVRPTPGEVLAEPDQPIQWIYLPHDCVISLTVPMEAGVIAEAATVGREGMTGYTAIFGERLAFARSLVQVGGTADKLPIETFAAAFESDETVRRATVAVALQAMRRQPILSQGRGVIDIRDRAALQEASCACYRIVRAHYDRVLLPNDRKTSNTVQTAAPGRG